MAKNNILFLIDRPINDAASRFFARLCMRMPDPWRISVASFEPKQQAISGPGRYMEKVFSHFQRPQKSVTWGVSAGEFNSAFHTDYKREGEPLEIHGATVKVLDQEPTQVRAAAKELLPWMQQREIGAVISCAPDADELALSLSEGNPPLKTIAWRRPGEAQPPEKRKSRPAAGSRLRAMDRVVVSTRRERDLLAHELNIADGQAFLIHPGVDLAQFTDFAAKIASLKEPVPPQGGALAWAGPFQEDRGIESLLWAVVELKAKRPKIKCYLAGQGPQRQKFFELTQKLGASYEVSFVGTRLHPATFLKSSAIFASLDVNDGFRLEALEAMALGTPTILADSGSARELAFEDERDEACCALTPPDDADALAKTIDSLLDDRERRLSLAKAGRERIESGFRIEAAIQAWTKLFESL